MILVFMPLQPSFCAAAPLYFRTVKYSPPPFAISDRRGYRSSSQVGDDITLPLFNPVTFLRQSLVWVACNSDAALAPFLRNGFMQGCTLGILTAA